MTVLIVEDEPHARRALQRTLERHRDVTVAGVCGDGSSALNAIISLRPDVVFLDIRIPDPDGFALLRALPEDSLPMVVFVTAFSDHAVQAFEVNAVDYIVKPFEESRIDRSLDKIRTLRASGAVSQELAKLAALLKRLPSERTSSVLTVRNRGRQTLIPFHEIESLEADGDYVHITAGTVHVVHLTLQQALEQLPPSFVRIHRSVVVNSDKIKELRSRLRGDFLVVLHSGRTLPMSRTYRETITALLGQR